MNESEWVVVDSGVGDGWMEGDKNSLRRLFLCPSFHRHQVSLTNSSVSERFTAKESDI